MLPLKFQEIIKNATNASKLTYTDVIQSLWSGYGEILRIGLEGSKYPSIIVKHICFPDQHRKKQRRSQSDRSHQRKVRSYQVEMHWYKQWSEKCNLHCRIPRCLAQETLNNEILLVLEDLDSVGFSRRKSSVSVNDAKICLSWLANFHALFMGERPEGLWKTGTYWHLATRPEELNNLKDTALKEAAPVIDRILKACPFQTIVHGDAKLANFCFSRDSKQIAAVDFQYVGEGCGMKDVVYLISSCFYDNDAERLKQELLEFYFDTLRKALLYRNYTGDIDDLERRWRNLYPYAWTDFHRFLKGWTYDQWSKNCYSERISQQVITQLLS